MKPKLRKEEMKVGVKYKGYGFINEFKEFCFQPEATGSQAGREKMLMNWPDELMTIKETKNYLIISMKEPKESQEAERARSLMAKFNLLFNFLRTHEV
jgi:hypothetical protein